jgi:hypothetical protein
MWGELLGHGFQEPLDDLGPDRKPIAPKAFEFLSREFAASDYDIKWLLRVITSTTAYQRESRPRHDSGDVHFAASCTQKLRADQLYNAITTALGIDEAEVERRRGGPKGAIRAANNSPRGQMLRDFNYDPSDRRDEVASSIPQALWMMNSAELNRQLNGKNAATSLGRLLSEEKHDDAVAVELYLRTLAREPNAGELKKCLDYVSWTGNRVAAFEDILWALLNSTEFLNRK